MSFGTRSVISQGSFLAFKMTRGFTCACPNRIIQPIGIYVNPTAFARSERKRFLAFPSAQAHGHVCVRNTDDVRHGLDSKAIHYMIRLPHIQTSLLMRKQSPEMSNYVAKHRKKHLEMAPVAYNVPSHHTVHPFTTLVLFMNARCATLCCSTEKLLPLPERSDPLSTSQSQQDEWTEGKGTADCKERSTAHKKATKARQDGTRPQMRTKKLPGLVTSVGCKTFLGAKTVDNSRRNQSITCKQGH